MLSILIYLLIGLIGIPVFSAGGGIFYVTQPTFGYLLAMPIATIVAGALPKKQVNERAYGVRIALNVVAVIIIHVIGVTYMYCISNFLHANISNPTSRPQITAPMMASNILVKLPSVL